MKLGIYNISLFYACFYTQKSLLSHGNKQLNKDIVTLFSCAWTWSDFTPTLQIQSVQYHQNRLLAQLSVDNVI